MSAANGRSRISAKEFVAATGVILSLVFVGFEIRQNTLAVRSSTLQALSDAHRDLVLESLLSQEHSALVSRTFLGETSEGFTDHENTRLVRRMPSNKRLLQSRKDRVARACRAR